MNHKKLPYLRKLKKIDDVTFWEVDGEYIRTKIGKDFNNYGHQHMYHHRFPFIPKNEIWIDKEMAPGETNYYIENCVTTRLLMRQGFSYSDAVYRAGLKEKKERAKSELAQKTKAEKEKIHTIPPELYKKLLKTYSSRPIETWVVNGEIVRDLYLVDFTEGGHHFVYGFVPKNQIWVDDDVKSRERKFVIFHELHERALMAKGMDYLPAHELSWRAEKRARRFPALTYFKIKRELKKNK